MPLSPTALKRAMESVGDAWPDMPAGSDGLDEIVGRVIQSNQGEQAMTDLVSRLRTHNFSPADLQRAADRIVELEECVQLLSNQVAVLQDVIRESNTNALDTTSRREIVADRLDFQSRLVTVEAERDALRKEVAELRVERDVWKEQVLGRLISATRK